MLRVPTKHAKPGMVLARGVIHPQRPGTVLLRKRFVLDESTIARLEQMRVGEVWVEFPPLAFIGEHVSPEVQRLRGSTMQLVGNAFERLGAGEASVVLHYSEYSATIRDLCKAIIADPRASLCLEHLAEGDVALARHSAEVAYLALLLGIKLDGYIIEQRRRVSPHRAKDIVNLGLGAMLHDIGLVGTPLEAVTGIPEVEHEEIDAPHHVHGRKRFWIDHTVRGYLLVRGSLHPSASVAILNHHQSCDGYGFPGWKTLDRIRLNPHNDPSMQTNIIRQDVRTPAPTLRDIHVFARIIAVADTFDRLRHAERGGPLPVVAAQQAMLRSPWTQRLDPHVVRALLAVVPAYGPGTIVRLSDGRQAAVIASNANDPCRPMVQILDDDWAEQSIAHSDDTATVSERLDLTRHPDLAIVEAGGVRTEAYNFDLSGLADTRGPEASRDAA